MFCVWTSSPVNMFVCILLSDQSFSQPSPASAPTNIKPASSARFIPHAEAAARSTSVARREEAQRPSTGLYIRDRGRPASLQLDPVYDPLVWCRTVKSRCHFCISVLTSLIAPKQDGLHPRASLCETNWLHTCGLPDESRSCWSYRLAASQVFYLPSFDVLLRLMITKHSLLLMLQIKSFPLVHHWKDFTVKQPQEVTEAVQHAHSFI